MALACPVWPASVRTRSAATVLFSAAPSTATSAAANLNSTLVAGAGKVLLSSQYQGNGAGMIIDVETDLDEIALRADDMGGGSTLLRPGRNYVPVSAYKSSSVAFDFEGNHPPAANIQPARSSYHLNKGGVDYRKVSVMKPSPCWADC